MKHSETQLILRAKPAGAMPMSLMDMTLAGRSRGGGDAGSGLIPEFAGEKVHVDFSRTRCGGGGKQSKMRTVMSLLSRPHF